MSIQSVDIFDLAILAEACYAKYELFDSTKDALVASRFSETQAVAPLKDWSVVNGAHRANTNTGFSC